MNEKFKKQKAWKVENTMAELSVNTSLITINANILNVPIKIFFFNLFFKSQLPAIKEQKQLK